MGMRCSDCLGLELKQTTTELKRAIESSKEMLQIGLIATCRVTHLRPLPPYPTNDLYYPHGWAIFKITKTEDINMKITTYPKSNGQQICVQRNNGSIINRTITTSDKRETLVRFITDYDARKLLQSRAR